MHKLITAVTLIALVAAGSTGIASAKPANVGQYANTTNAGVFQYPVGQPTGPKKKGGPITSPGDAFYPDTGDVACEGKIKRQFDDAGILQIICLE